MQYKFCWVWSIVWLLSSLSFDGQTEDWPNWRGPRYNGISVEKNWNPNKVSQGKILWQKDVGIGYSSVAVAKGKLYTMGNQNGRDVIFCFDAKTGQEIWRYDYQCSAGNSYPGTRATPTVTDKYVITCSREGHVVCLDTQTGKMIWTQMLKDVAQIKIPQWGLSSSALVLNNTIIFNAGEHGIALNLSNGNPLWKSNGQGSYATAIPYPPNSKGQYTDVIIFSAQAAIGVSLSSGNSKWKVPLTNRYQVNAADPILIDSERMYISTGYGEGGLLAELKGTQPKILWQNKHLCIHFSPPVVIDGYIYGVNGNAGRGELVCLDSKTGEPTWKASQPNFGIFMVADNKIIYLNEGGGLYIIEVNPQKYVQLAFWQTPLGRTCWTTPVLANGIIYCRNDKGKLIAIDVM